jgi:hypothetical protein
VKDILTSLAEGDSEDEILRNFPQLERDDIHAAVAWAVSRLEDRATEPKLQSAFKSFVDSIDSREIGRIKSRLEQLRARFVESWRSTYDEKKQNPHQATEILQRELDDNRELFSLILATGRRNETELFRPIKKTIEYVLTASDGLGGYASVLGVPHAAAGFYYCALTTVALDNESWKLLHECLNTKFEWSQSRSHNIFQFGFNLSPFFHSDVFGRDAAKCHDFFRGNFMNPDVLQTLDREWEDLFDSYVQAQFLMSLRSAQERQKGNLDSRIWADFGRFHDYRIGRLLDRAYWDPEVGEGIARCFEESRDEFFDRLNSRLGTIRQDFWGGGSGYFYDSVTQWVPTRA